MIVFGKERDYIIHNDDVVKGFFSAYRFLSNYHECKIRYEGFIYGSTEAAYQSSKSLDTLIREQFTLMKPNESRSNGRKIQIRPDWDEVRLKVMEDVCRIKFTTNLYLKEMMLETGSRYLEETNHWGDTFFGVCNGVGENNLGKILMKIRSQLN
jgi:ribA/ribD-fused uncharacterized protein